MKPMTWYPIENWSDFELRDQKSTCSWVVFGVPSFDGPEDPEYDYIMCRVSHPYTSDRDGTLCRDECWDDYRLAKICHFFFHIWAAPNVSVCDCVKNAILRDKIIPYSRSNIGKWKDMEGVPMAGDCASIEPQFKDVSSCEATHFLVLDLPALPAPPTA